jgi:hypothetical protein
MSDHGPALPPALRFIPVGAIRAHEQPEAGQAEDLRGRIGAEGVLRNPVAVAELAPGEYLLVDGTHRYESLRAGGYGYALAQVAPLTAPTVIDTWSHAARVDADRFLDAVAAAGLAALPAGLAAAEEAVTFRRAPFAFALRDRPAAAFVADGRGDRARALRAFVALYQPRRVTNDEILARGGFDPARLFAEWAFAEANLIVRFAAFSPDEIVAQVRNGARIPAGITRFVLGGGRVLGVDVPVRLLAPAASAAEQGAWLAQLARRRPRRFAGPARVRETRPRLYAEPLLVYDPDLVVEPA